MQTEEALRKFRKEIIHSDQLLAVIEYADSGIMITDDHGKALQINRALQKILGLNGEKSAAKVLLSLALTNEGKKSFLPLNARQKRVRYKKPDGGERTLKCIVYPVCDTSARIERYVFIVLDVTRESELEEQLRQARKMDIIGRLSAGIAHDLKNILTPIIGNIELALDDMPKEHPVCKNLLSAHRAAIRGRDLVSRILSFGRKTEEQQKVLHLIPLLKETLRLIQASLPSNIRIVSNTKTEADMILADPTEVQQVLLNLAINAAQAMHKRGGLLEINLYDARFSRSDKLPSASMTPGDYVALMVRDTGFGMKDKVKKRLFESFFTTKRQGRGTGLGLTIVNDIVRRNGAAITVDSEQGKGSTFTVYFRRFEEAEETGKESDLPMPRGKERILLVDDEGSVLDVMSELLKRLGYDTAGEVDCTRALQIFAKDPARFDLVIVNQFMPLMTGVALAEKLLQIRSDIPVLLLTGDPTSVLIEQAKTQGIREVLHKPLTQRELAEAIRRGLTKTR